MDIAYQDKIINSKSEVTKMPTKLGSRKRLCNPIYLWIAGLVFLCVAICPIRFGRTVGESMLPTLKSNQIFLMYRCFGNNYVPNRNDVIVFKYDGEVMVKRVWATPGDSIWIVKYSTGSSLIAVSDVALWRTTLKRSHLGKLYKLELKPDEMFVLGDNFNDSCDSRDFGPIKTSTVLGRVRIPESQDKQSYHVAYAGTKDQSQNQSY